MPGAAPTPEDALSLLDAAAVRRWSVLVRSALASRRAEIDELNVFPVPDGDTGTNLYLTFDAAVERTLAHEETGGAGALLVVFAKSLLWTARGNSGVILSQLARGLADACQHLDVIDGPALAAGLLRADERAWQAVSDPKDGTILSVARAVSEAAQAAAGDGLYAVSLAALDAGRLALARTPEQLPVLARAGVVDAGGAGYVIMLECLERLCAGDDGRVALGLGSTERRARPGLPRAAGSPAAVSDPGSLDRGDGGDGDQLGDDWEGPTYEVMFLLRDSGDEAVAILRERLVSLGDSVLVVGGEQEWHVHAHVDDAGAAVEAGIDAGRPHRVRITHLVTDWSRRHRVTVTADVDDPAPVADGSCTGAAHRSRGQRSGIVACTVGEGLADVFRAAGAVVVPARPGRRASTGSLIEAIHEQHDRGGDGVVVLPNDEDTELAAAAAARAVADDGIEALVVRARTVVQGIAALAVFEPAASVRANVQAMQSAASATRHGGVTVATRAALTSGGECRPGDVLGVVDGDVVVVGSDEVAVAGEVVHRLLSSGGELLTLVMGASAPTGLAQQLAARARAERPGVEVSEIVGGQGVYSVLLGVE